MTRVATLIGIGICAFTIAGAAHADGWRHDRHWHSNDRWVGPAVALGIAGLVIGAAAADARTDTRTYSAPPAPYVQPRAPEYWYYCRSSRQYHPYVAYCPEGWIEVPPTPR